MRRLLAGVPVAAAAVLALGAGAANACQYPSIGPIVPPASSGPDGPAPYEVGPGEEIRYGISNTAPGAQYVVSINGERQVDSGTAEGDSVADSFTLPELPRSTKAVTLSVQVDHEDIPDGRWQDTAKITIKYRARAGSAPAEQPPAAQQPSQGPATNNAPQPNSTSPATTPAGGGPNGPGGPGWSGPEGLRPVGPNGAAPRGSSGAPVSRQREAVLPQTPTRADAADGRTTTVAQQRVIAREKAAPAPVDRRARVRSERSLNHQLRTLSRPSAPEGGLSPISLGLLVLLTAGPAAAFLIRYRRPGDGIAAEKAPVTPSAGAGALSLEAELQEIVAEHKAREVLERDRAGPVG